MATETTDLVSGGGGAEDEALGEAPPREPSSSAPALALRNASSLQRHAEDEHKKQQHRRRHGWCVAHSLSSSPWATKGTHAGTRERARDPTEVGSKARRGKNNNCPADREWVRVAA
jgi:hypothetical protein